MTYKHSRFSDSFSFFYDVLSCGYDLLLSLSHRSVVHAFYSIHSLRASCVLVCGMKRKCFRQRKPNSLMYFFSMYDLIITIIICVQFFLDIFFCFFTQPHYLQTFQFIISLCVECLIIGFDLFRRTVVEFKAITTKFA